MTGDTLAIFLPQANQPPAVNYAALFIRNGHPVLAFDTTTQQTAIFSGLMPRNYNGGNIIVIIAWMAATAVAGTIGWGASFERMNANNNDLDADAWGGEALLAPLAVNAVSGKVTLSSVNMNPGGILAGESFRLRIRRDVANDTAAGDAHLLSVELVEN